MLDGRLPLEAHRYPLPKANGGTRVLTHLGPIDEVVLRVLVGACTAALRRTESPQVFSYRLAAGGAGWFTEHHRPAIRARRAEGVRLLRSAEVDYLGVTDVRSFYPSVSIEVLLEQLARADVPFSAAQWVGAFLRSLHSLGAAGGLPIGFEGSGVLATFLLRSVDESIRGLGVDFIRFCDDYWLFVPSEQAWLEAVDAEVAQLDQLGLDLNASKVALYAADSPNALDVIVNGRLDSIIDECGGLVDGETAFELLESNLDPATANERELRFAFGALGRLRDVRAAQVIADNPLLFVEHPVAVGDYLEAISADPGSRRLLRIDQIVGWSEGGLPGGTRNLAARVHSMRISRKMQLPKELGERLGQLSTDVETAAQVPLRSWAAFGASRSEGRRPATAIECARYEGSPAVRRAHLLGLTGKSLGASDRRSLVQLARIEPELEPTVAYIVARAA